MERLWTPWRRAFVEGGNDRAAEGCFLCAKPADDPAHDRENLILSRGPLTYVLLNLYPYNNGHLLIAPYQHTGNLVTLAPDIASEMMRSTQTALGALEREYHPDAFNVGMNLGAAAGAGVPDHLHTHVVPRWNGDTNFMPVLGSTKVMPETLEQTYDRLVSSFRLS